MKGIAAMPRLPRRGDCIVLSLLCLCLGLLGFIVQLPDMMRGDLIHITGYHEIVLAARVRASCLHIVL